jgi:2-polyprenyl-6-hydroxyphenyl methylase/3-demethylubiquinone-9 3-methyltransferase
MPSFASDLSIYAAHGAEWWSGRHRWLRALQNLVPARLRHFTGIVGDWRGKTVLDLGCGGGFMSEALARLGARVTGVDPCAEVIAIAKAHAATSALSIDYRVGTGERLPLFPSQFDCVVSADVLEHVADLDLVLDEVRRALKPGGLFLFDTINRTKLAAFVYVTLGERVLRIVPRGTHDPAQFIRPADLATKLAARGFEVGRMVGLGPVGLDRRLDFTFGRLPTLALSYMGHAMAPVAREARRRA